MLASTFVYCWFSSVRILLSFTGFHDPFTGTGGNATAGPVLTVLSERPLDSVFLFTTPKLAEVSQATEEAIIERYPDISVELLNVSLEDPTNYSRIISEIRKQFKAIHREYPDAEYSISLSSGTPQMHACWLMLVVSGEIPGTLIQTTPPHFLPEGAKLAKDVVIDGEQFPRIVIRDRIAAETSDKRSVDEIRRELGIVGDDPAFMKALQEAALYGEYDDIHLLLLGETGTGKELFTQLVHRVSQRHLKPLITVNCSSIPTELVESHLFGHKRGSFTGATADHEGKFRAANGGILFLDELGELPLSAQAKLLRALEYGEVEPVGHTQPVKLNVRVIAATNRNLRKMVADGGFREDLYQRFGASVSIPSLRKRRTDIPQLANYILEVWNKRHRKQRKLSGKALSQLSKHPWPGNIRELRRVITQSAMLTEKVTITDDELSIDEPISSPTLNFVPEPVAGFELSPYLEQIKEEIIARALEKESGVQARAARLIGWTPQALSQYLKSPKRKDL